MEVNIGVDAEKRKEIAAGLSNLLADTYTLYLKTHNYHWNVKGPMFQTLHLMFEQQYTALALAVDEIAERILVLGFSAPGTFKQYGQLSAIKEEDKIPNANQMILNLKEANETVVKRAKEVLPILEGSSDEGTLGLLSTRIEYHEKTAWMLRSLLED